MHGHSALEFVIQDGERVFQTLYDIDVLRLGLVHVGVFLDGMHQVRDPGCAALDLDQQVRDFHRSRNPHQRSPGNLCVQGREQRLQRFWPDAPARQIGRHLPEIALSMTAQQGINLVFEIGHGQRIQRSFVRLHKRSFQLLNF